MSQSDTFSALRRPLVLVGMMGAGKSSVGRKLAELLRAPFKDCDWEIEVQAGMVIRDLFAARGEAAFRALESEMITRLMALRPPAVIAAGGGTFVQEGNRKLMLEQAQVVWLQVSFETLTTRLMGAQMASRPLLAGAQDPRTALKELMAQRAPLYAQAHLTVSVDGLKVDEIARRILAQVKDNLS